MADPSESGTPEDRPAEAGAAEDRLPEAGTRGDRPAEAATPEAGTPEERPATEERRQAAERREPEAGAAEERPVGPGATEQHRPPSPPPPGSAEEALRRLEQRLDRASEAAERLMAQAAEAAARGVRGGHPGGAESPASQGEGEDRAKPPPAGWQVPEDSGARLTPDLDPFVALIQAVRDLIPPELQRRLVAALRELLLALRALIDWYLERLERKREQSIEVQDIPIL